MSTLAVVLVVIGAALLVLFVGGLVAASRWRREQASDYARHVVEADRALEQARAADKGWDRAVLEATARDALADRRPGWSYEDLVLVLVDDKPGVAEDRAHFVASGAGGVARVVLARHNSGWALERVE